MLPCFDAVTGLDIFLYVLLLNRLDFTITTFQLFTGVTNELYTVHVVSQ